MDFENLDTCENCGADLTAADKVAYMTMCIKCGEIKDEEHANLQNLVVFIKDEAELQQAREMLEANGQIMCNDGFYLSEDNYYKYLYFNYNFGWCLGIKMPLFTQITLTELEQLLKQNRDENS